MKIDKKKMVLWFFLTKIPFVLLIVLTLVNVPAIEALEYSTIMGAHRGDSVEHTENTMAAFEAAVAKECYEFIEFDVQYTKDDVPVVYHDKSLRRLQGLEEKVPDLTVDELEFISKYSIPRYSDVMDILGDSKKINVEIKSNGDFEDDKKLVDYVVSDAIERGVLDKIMISAISSDVVEYVTENYPEIKTGKIYWVTYSTFFRYDFLTDDLYEHAHEIGADYLMLHGSNIENIESLIDTKPEDVTLCFWYFSNEMHIVEADESDGIW